MALDRGESIRDVFVDFAKAFDHVDHGLVVARLIEFGVPGYMIRWIYSFLENRQQRVRIGKILSDWPDIERRNATRYMARTNNFHHPD